MSDFSFCVSSAEGASRECGSVETLLYCIKNRLKTESALYERVGYLDRLF